MMPDVVTLKALMQGLSASGQVVAGFAVLAQAEASGSLPPSGEGCFGIFHALLEACRGACDPDSACLVQAAVERLGLGGRSAHAREHMWFKGPRCRE